MAFFSSTINYTSPKILIFLSNSYMVTPSWVAFLHNIFWNSSRSLSLSNLTCLSSSYSWFISMFFFSTRVYAYIYLSSALASYVFSLIDSPCIVTTYFEGSRLFRLYKWTIFSFKSQTSSFYSFIWLKRSENEDISSLSRRKVRWR